MEIKTDLKTFYVYDVMGLQGNIIEMYENIRAMEVNPSGILALRGNDVGVYYGVNLKPGWGWNSHAQEVTTKFEIGDRVEYEWNRFGQQIDQATVVGVFWENGKIMYNLNDRTARNGGSQVVVQEESTLTLVDETQEEV